MPPVNLRVADSLSTFSIMAVVLAIISSDISPVMTPSLLSGASLKELAEVGLVVDAFFKSSIKESPLFNYKNQSSMFRQESATGDKLVIELDFPCRVMGVDPVNPWK